MTDIKPGGVDGFRTSEVFRMDDLRGAYRVTVQVEYPHPDNPFLVRDDAKILIENSVLMRLLDMTTEQARAIINEYFPNIEPTTNK